MRAFSPTDTNPTRARVSLTQARALVLLTLGGTVAVAISTAGWLAIGNGLPRTGCAHIYHVCLHRRGVGAHALLCSGETKPSSH